MTRGARPFGAVIAERRLHTRETPPRLVIVSLGRPRKTRGSPDWECPFRIEGAGVNRIEHGFGVDAFQALTMALEGIRYVLDRSGLSLAWPGVLEHHTGFQRVIPLIFEKGGTRRLERVVERELRRQLEHLKDKHRSRLAPARKRLPARRRSP